MNIYGCDLSWVVRISVLSGEAAFDKRLASDFTSSFRSMQARSIVIGKTDGKELE